MSRFGLCFITSQKIFLFRSEDRRAVATKRACPGAEAGPFCQFKLMRGLSAHAVQSAEDFGDLGAGDGALTLKSAGAVAGDDARTIPRQDGLGVLAVSGDVNDAVDVLHGSQHGTVSGPVQDAGHFICGGGGGHAVSRLVLGVDDAVGHAVVVGTLIPSLAVLAGRDGLAVRIGVGPGGEGDGLRNGQRALRVEAVIGALEQVEGVGGLDVVGVPRAIGDVGEGNFESGVGVEGNDVVSTGDVITDGFFAVVVIGNIDGVDVDMAVIGVVHGGMVGSVDDNVVVIGNIDGGRVDMAIVGGSVAGCFAGHGFDGRFVFIEGVTHRRVVRCVDDDVVVIRNIDGGRVDIAIGGIVVGCIVGVAVRGVVLVEGIAHGGIVRGVDDDVLVAGNIDGDAVDGVVLGGEGGDGQGQGENESQHNRRQAG